MKNRKKCRCAMKEVVSKEKDAGIKRKRYFFSMRSLALVYSYLEDLKGNQRVLFSNSAVAMRE